MTFFTHGILSCKLESVHNRRAVDNSIVIAGCRQFRIDDVLVADFPDAGSERIYVSKKVKGSAVSSKDGRTPGCEDAVRRLNLQSGFSAECKSF